jgi:CheY-like chemotaxis protein
MQGETTKAALPVNAGTKALVILLVEDEPFVREVTREVLRHGGYVVIESASPEEALSVATHHQGHIDLLLTDVVMPGMNGAELAYRLQDIQPGLVTVFMSGYAESEVVKKMRRTSVIHIQKPFTVDVLLSRITQALNSSVVSAQGSNSSSVSV